MSSYHSNTTEIGMKTMDEFDDTFNIAFNIRNENFDWFNNSYIKPNLYEFDENYIPRLSTKATLKICDEEDLLKFSTISYIQWQKNSLCIEHKDKLHLKGNWYDETFSSIYISLDYCDEQIYKGRCKSRKKID